MKAVKIEKNQAGKRYAIVRDGDAFAVYAESANYCRHVRGGIARAWRYCKKGLNREAAEAMFARKVAGKVRA